MKTDALQKSKCRAIALALCMVAVGWAVHKQLPCINQRVQAVEEGDKEELNQLLQARYQTATTLLEIERKRLEEGRATLVQVCESARRVRDSALELPGSLERRMAALTNYLSVVRQLEENVNNAVDKGAAPPVERESARYMRLDAEIALLRARQSQSK